MTRREPAPSLPVETYRALIDELQAHWFNPSEPEVKSRNLPIARFVFALAANSFAKSETLDVLWDQGHWAQSMPIVRNCFESAVFAGWTQQSGQGGVDALVWEQSRQNMNALDQAEQAGVEVPETVREAVRLARSNLVGTPGQAGEARNFERLCTRIDGGLYLMYRHLSSEAHAAGSISKHLRIDPRDSNNLLNIMRPESPDGLQRLAASTVAYSLVWAGRAFSEICLGKPGKQKYRRAAQQLRIPPLLTFK